MNQPTRLALAFLLLATLPSSLASAAVEPSSFLGLTGFSGKGKHPKTTQTAVLIEGNHSGRHFVCFSYGLFTGAEIKGSLDVEIDLVEAGQARELRSLKRVPIEQFEIFTPEPTNDPCNPEPDDEIDFNYGIATECEALSTTLHDGDLVLYRFRFRKGSRLKGPRSVLNVVASVLPSRGASATTAAEVEQLALEQALEGLRNSVSALRWDGFR